MIVMGTAKSLSGSGTRFAGFVENYVLHTHLQGEVAARLLATVLVVNQSQFCGLCGITCRGPNSAFDTTQGPIATMSSWQNQSMYYYCLRIAKPEPRQDELVANRTSQQTIDPDVRMELNFKGLSAGKLRDKVLLDTGFDFSSK